MAEGFFHPGQLQIPGLTPDALCAAMVRILPRTLLVLDIAETAEDARRQARNEPLPDGSECWYRFFTPGDLSSIGDAEFAMGMVRHEFAKAVKSGAAFPVTVPLDGGGSGFAIDASGHVLTNHHLVTSEVAKYGREAGAIGEKVPCMSLQVQVAQQDAVGGWRWRDANRVWLVSDPPAARVFEHVEGGAAQLREDTALLRAEPSPSGTPDPLHGRSSCRNVCGWRASRCAAPEGEPRSSASGVRMPTAACGSLPGGFWRSTRRAISYRTSTGRWARAAHRSSTPLAVLSACSRAPRRRPAQRVRVWSYEPRAGGDRACNPGVGLGMA